eukprot:SAG11_NODE_460_length_9258_cov_3.010698_2_plen_805_part_00
MVKCTALMVAVAAAAVLPAVGAVESTTTTSYSLRGVLLDQGWKFFRGNAPEDAGRFPSCPPSAFPKTIGRCKGLKHSSNGATTDSCRAACCADSSCLTWQLGGPATDMNGQCWIGATTNCAATNEGWTTGARVKPPSTPPPPAPPPSFARADFDDSGWRTVEVPHDWSSEDLPDRSEDFDTPAITIRNGTWKFHQGDDSSWSAAGFDDSNWTAVTVPFDWRGPPTLIEGHATGWFRRHFTLSAKALSAYKLASSPLRLAVGETACSSMIYVNGGKVSGGTGGRTQGCLEFQVPELDLTNLAAGDNVVAVRVTSPGGKAPHGMPGGLCDAGALAKHGVSVATGSDWEPPSPFDPAVSTDPPAPPRLCSATALRLVVCGSSLTASVLQRTSLGRSNGFSVNGVGWYRLTFNHSRSHHIVINEQTKIAFDGVYMNADFWINGFHLGNHPYGYTYFQYDLTKLLVDGSNTIAVRVKNEGKNSRWYSGSGIFRHVHLITTPAVHIGQWGVVVQTSDVSATSATIGLNVTCENNGANPAAHAAVTATVLDATGNVVSTATTDVPSLAAGGGSAVVQIRGLKVPNPKMWCLDTPHLYRVKVQLTDQKGSPPGSNVDTVVETFGIRTLHFSATDGFKLNGKKVLLYGGCVHHDNGPLGSATIDRAEERRVENLKKLGYNAIRTSHNPVSPVFLDACDRLGMLVMHEAFDCWEKGKNTDDYHVFFDDWWRRDLASMVRGSINRPSIALWSIGNEIPMRCKASNYGSHKPMIGPFLFCFVLSTLVMGSSILTPCCLSLTSVCVQGITCRVQTGP